MIDGRDPYTVPLFGPQGDVEKPAAATPSAPGTPADPPVSKAPWTPPAPAGGAEKMPWEPAANGGPAAAAPPRAASPDEDGNPAMMAHEIKARIHKQLIERLNLSNLDSHDRETVVAEIRRAIQDLLARDAAPLNFDERERLVEEVLHEIFGLGPLEPLLQDPTVSDILVNTHTQVYIERDGRIERTDVRFKDNRHLLQVIDRIVSAVGRRARGRLARQRGHTAAGDRRAPRVDPQVQEGRAVRSGPPARRDDHSFHARSAAGDRQSAPQRADLGRHGLR